MKSLLCLSAFLLSVAAAQAQTATINRFGNGYIINPIAPPNTIAPPPITITPFGNGYIVNQPTPYQSYQPYQPSQSYQPYQPYGPMSED